MAHRRRHFLAYLHRPSKQPVAQDIIPYPDLFNTLVSTPSGTRPAQERKTDLPTAGQCAVHLELLEVFHSLRTRIICSKELDRAFGLHSSRLRNLRHRRESQGTEKWHRFVSLAVERFQGWIRAAETLLEQDGTDETHILPPVDILMVWHAFLLNPLDYKTFCTGHQFHRTLEVPFPWGAIHESINPTTWSYTLPSQNKRWLESEANIPTDLFLSLTETTQTRPSQQSLNTASTPTENEALMHNVLRQTIFIDHMHTHMWIQSPDVEEIISDARESYNNFVELLRLHPGVILVPTLAIDLVWHTHLCSAARYTAFMMERVGRFINHDDKLGKGTLDDGFERTKALFEKEFESPEEP
ncbi:hypothetical protein BO78DRAFT_470120 [Aspergillus sclerotiicarbonarius CBS 121057]|uniref:Uncharacterized protein n=1 Tax=Aspergillus sclerotiicarbonarius (strain CBS 121057 / IBT 28362) TaxID=1448318 RepID=A0A319FGP3_ASPSB|nr:hypothetical protein BO78DRAFT_470120 [Aspergillus sclerotiicarbonarius CBS 121057]